MTKYDITEEKFKSLINYREMIKESGCKNPRYSGTYPGTSGHENCDSCSGNYYNKGECNFGGRHVLANEVAQINRNFDGVDKLEDRHNQLRLSANTNQSEFEQKKNALLNDFDRVKNCCSNPSSFLYASCIGVHGHSAKFLSHVNDKFKQFAKGIQRYIDQIQNLSWHQVEEFQAKIQEIKKIQEANQQLLQEYKDPNTTPERKAQIMVVINQNKQKIQNLSNELNKHPARTLFDPETTKILGNAKRNILDCPGGRTDPFAGLGKSKGNNSN
jgi:hypothetical protein